MPAMIVIGVCEAVCLDVGFVCFDRKTNLLLLMIVADTMLGNSAARRIP